MRIKNNTRLRRYTSLPILLDMLIHKRITLLDPESWEDRNDSFYVEKYKEIKCLKSVLALCFTSRPETFHHWKVFSGNSSGICVRFNKAKLLKSVNRISGIKSDYVKYKLIRELSSNTPSLDELPFIKRKQYEDEEEFRIVYTNKSKEIKSKNITIDLDSIEKITLSPWLPLAVSKTIKNVIGEIDGCDSIELIRTGVMDNKVWKNIASKIA